MFERFTDRSRRVLVLAQEEGRLLSHAFIGTEHILMGLIDEGEGVAAKVLTDMGVTQEYIRNEVEKRCGRGTRPVPGSPPFTPRAKKVLKLSLREALQLGHSYIGTEHLLLGLIREGSGVGAQILVEKIHFGDMRQKIIETITGSKLKPVPTPSERIDPLKHVVTRLRLAEEVCEMAYRILPKSKEDGKTGVRALDEWHALRSSE